MNRKDKAKRAEARALGKDALAAWEAEHWRREMDRGHKGLERLYLLTMGIIVLAVVLYIAAFLAGRDMTPVVMFL